MKISIVIFIISAFSNNAFAVENCTLGRDRLQNDLSLDFNSFDQTQGQGHREYADKGCFLEAAKLIDIYHIHNKNNLLPWQDRVLSFHAGQMYSFENLYDIALIRFDRTFNPNELPTSELAWNAYVAATIAFLEKNKISLEESRRKIASKPTLGNKINLRVVDAFIRCFDKPYKEAYSEACFAK